MCTYSKLYNPACLENPSVVPDSRVSSDLDSLPVGEGRTGAGAAMLRSTLVLKHVLTVQAALLSPSAIPLLAAVGLFQMGLAIVD